MLREIAIVATFAEVVNKFIHVECEGLVGGTYAAECKS